MQHICGAENRLFATFNILIQASSVTILYTVTLSRFKNNVTLSMQVNAFILLCWSFYLIKIFILSLYFILLIYI